MELPASSSGLPSTPGQKSPPALPIALTPGQIVSARVLEALGADTYLLALRGRTLVANSPTPLTPDTIVQLAVQAAEHPDSPVPVKLLATAVLSDRAPASTAETRVAAMITELGLPPGPAAALTVAAFTRLGVPLADPRTSNQTKPSAALRSVLQVVQAAIDTGGSLEPALESTDTKDSTDISEAFIPMPQSDASRGAPQPNTATTTNPVRYQSSLNVTRLASGQVIAIANTPATEPLPAAQSEATEPAEANSETSANPRGSAVLPARPLTTTSLPSTNEPRLTAAPILVSQARLTLGVHGIVTFTPTSPLVGSTSTSDPAATQSTLGPPEKPTATSNTDVDRPTPPTPSIPRASGMSRATDSPHSLDAPTSVSKIAAAPSISPITLPAHHAEESSLAEHATTRTPSNLTTPDSMPVEARKAANISVATNQLSPGIRYTSVIPTAGDRSPDKTASTSRSDETPLVETYEPRTARSRTPGIIASTTSTLTDTTSPAPQRSAALRPQVLPSPLQNATAVRVRGVIMPPGALKTGTSGEASRRNVIASPIIAAAMAQVAATATPSELAAAGARLGRVSLPVTPATLAVALRAPNAQLPAAARWLPPGLAITIDPAVSSPTAAIRTALQLAGVVPAGITTDPAQTLLQHLIRIAISVGSATPVSASNPTTESTSEPLPATPTILADATSRVPLPAPISTSTADSAAKSAAESTLEATRDPAVAGAPIANETPRGSDPAMAAVHDVAAQHLLPPTHLDDYDRVIPLPMMHAGQPVPARLAVTTRRTASGGTACWMRVDCALSHLGAVSVRLSGADGGPVAVTLIAAPAAAAVLADALPALTDDLHAKGVVAALRVVAHTGDLTEVA